MNETHQPDPSGGPAKCRRGRYPSQFRKDAASLVLDQRRTIADVARELGVNEQTLGNWVRQERIERGEAEGMTRAEREEMTRLRRQLKQVRWNETSQTIPGLLDPGGQPVTRYRWIAHREAEGFPVAVACRAARISRQAYYAWRHRRNRGEDPEHLVLASELRAIWEASDGTYGSPRVTHELRRRGFCVNHKRVERLMRDLGIAASPPRRFVRTTRRGEDAPLPDLVQRTSPPQSRGAGM